ncbi:MAG: alcohol dehydrogenase catalytic domain-containing protein [Spirochaetales bacterium]|nr:alcohol dehydrogenase catalytic domain-containing protein [Spirochaetales bacterium]
MAQTMKAQVFYEAEKMALEERPVPEITDLDVLVKVKTVGICGSDVSYYYGYSPVDTPTGKGPIVLGHEFTGDVVQVGKVPASLGLYKEGDRVVVNPVQHCNACYACAEGHTHECANLNVPGVSADGGYAEYCRSNYTGLFKLPEAVDYAAGAFIEPLACAVNGMRRLDIDLGHFVVIFGPGPMGQMMVQMAKRWGAGRVALVGTRDYRLEWGKKSGADFVFNPSEKGSKYYVGDLAAAIRKANNGQLADRVIVATSSNAAFETGIDIAAACSILVHFGLPDAEDVIHVPALSFHTMDKQIRSAWLAPLSWPAAIRAIDTGIVKVKDLVSHTYKLEDTEKAIRSLKERKGDPMKVQIVI